MIPSPEPRRILILLSSWSHACHARPQLCLCFPTSSIADQRRGLSPGGGVSASGFPATPTETCMPRPRTALPSVRATPSRLCLLLLSVPRSSHVIALHDHPSSTTHHSSTGQQGQLLECFHLLRSCSPQACQCGKPTPKSQPHARPPTPRSASLHTVLFCKICVATACPLLCLHVEHSPYS